MPSKHQQVILDLTDDDEFTSCKVCHSHLRSYNNTSLSKTDDVDNAFTRHLLSHGHLHCEKCGLYIEIHPSNPSEEALIFVCSQEKPHKHCLCYECGLLYGLKPNTHKKNILSQLQYQNSTQPNTSAELASQSQNTSLLAAHGLAGMNVVTNGTLIADVLSSAMSTDPSDSNIDTSDGPSGSSEPSLNSLLPLLLVWLGIYLSSPFLFRLSGIAVWFLAFYVLLRFKFADNEAIQRAVFSLYTLAPLAGAGYLMVKARRMGSDKDIKSALQFVAVFALCVYVLAYGSPVAVVAEVAHFWSLSMGQRLVALFIAVSVVSFGALLLKMTCCNLMLWSFLRHCIEEAPLGKDLSELHEPDAPMGLELQLELKSDAVPEVSVSKVDSVVQPETSVEPKPKAKTHASSGVAVAKKKIQKSKKSRKRRRKRKKAPAVQAN